MAQKLTAQDTGSLGHLRAVFTVEPSPEADCTVVASGARSEDVSQDIICQDGDCERGCQCRAMVAPIDSGNKQFLKGSVDDHCVCPVFRFHDCIASIERFEGRSLEIELSVPDRTELERVVDAMRETGATVRLQSISSLNDGQEQAGLELDVRGITDKQREAVLVAVEEGYYEKPRRADLGDLAAELDVSKSAVSQRLSSVESNLVTSLFQRECSA